MGNRKYDLEEIDRMRGAVLELVRCGPYGPGNENPTAHAEDRLRTYMLNGTEPEALEQYAKLMQERRELEHRIYDAKCLLKQQQCDHEWGKISDIWTGDGKRERRNCAKCGKVEQLPKNAHA